MRTTWQQKISNKQIRERANINEISIEIRRRRWNWLGHIFRREGDNNCQVVLGWTPEGRRARGEPKTTWRRTVEKERNTAGWTTWKTAKTAAQDKTGWKTSISALCAAWHGED
jgi:hypothetical protein